NANLSVRLLAVVLRRRRACVVWRRGRCGGVRRAACRRFARTHAATVAHRTIGHRTARRCAGCAACRARIRQLLLIELRGCLLFGRIFRRRGRRGLVLAVMHFVFGLRRGCFRRRRRRCVG